VPAELAEETTKSIRAAALKVYDMVGAAGLTRVDFILDGRGRYFFLEINTVPGLTSLSLAPMAAQAVGISFDQLVEQLIREAAGRRGRRG
jgi:D-alanine-D-alanine ligase